MHDHRMLWRAVSAEVRGIPAFRRVQFAVQQVLVDMRELSVKRPGARLIHTLREIDWWDAVYRAEAS